MLVVQHRELPAGKMRMRIERILMRHEFPADNVVVAVALSSGQHPFQNHALAADDVEHRLTSDVVAVEVDRAAGAGRTLQIRDR